jgi:hypothetical protein
MALCKLHNYCIGLDDDDKENATTGELANSVESISTTADEDTPSSVEARDEHHISSHGGVDPRQENEAGPSELLGGGEHFDDVIVEDLPRAQGGTRRRLLQMVVDSDLHRNLASSRRFQSNLN